jgi:hypothetical protein
MELEIQVVILLVKVTEVLAVGGTSLAPLRAVVAVVQVP